VEFHTQEIQELNLKSTVNKTHGKSLVRGYGLAWCKCDWITWPYCVSMRI